MKDLRLSVSEAAKIFGLSQQTIRRSLKSSEVKYIVVCGRYKISFVSLLAWSQNKTTTKNKLLRTGIGQFVDNWKINNRLFSPHPENVKRQLSTNQE